MLESLEPIIQSLQPRHVLVEAAHVYTFESLDASHLRSAKVGGDVVSLLRGIGVTTEVMLFIDNYNIKGPIGPNSFIHKQDSFLSAYKGVGYEPELFSYEADMANEMEDWIAPFVADGKLKVNKKGIFFPMGGEGLLWVGKKEEEGMRFTCEGLDARMYVKKSETADLLITVLPESYRLQQEKTKRLLRGVGYNLPILNIYFDTADRVEVDFHF